MKLVQNRTKKDLFLKIYVKDKNSLSWAVRICPLPGNSRSTPQDLKFHILCILVTLRNDISRFFVFQIHRMQLLNYYVKYSETILF